MPHQAPVRPSSPAVASPATPSSLQRHCPLSQPTRGQWTPPGTTATSPGAPGAIPLNGAPLCLRRHHPPAPGCEVARRRAPSPPPPFRQARSPPDRGNPDSGRGAAGDCRQASRQLPTWPPNSRPPHSPPLRRTFRSAPSPSPGPALRARGTPLRAVALDGPPPTRRLAVHINLKTRTATALASFGVCFRPHTDASNRLHSYMAAPLQPNS